MWRAPCLSVLFLASLMGSCGGSDPDAETAQETAAANPTVDCATSYLTWSNFGEAFFLQWCTSCHHAGLVNDGRDGAPPGVDFDTYDGALIWSDEVDHRTFVVGDMPPILGPLDEERERLHEWIACGLAR